MSDLDRRTNAARVALEAEAAIVADLGGSRPAFDFGALGGPTSGSSVCRNAGCYARWLQGQEVSLTEIATIQNCYLRIAVSLGFSRRAKDVSIDINSYLAASGEPSSS